MAGESSVSAWLAAGSAVVAAVSAIFSYLLSKRIYDEIKSDEAIVSGPLHRVGLPVKDHDDPLVRVTLFNKSARKAYITRVRVLDQDNQQIPVTWSNSISDVGNIENPTGILGIIDSANIYIRNNAGSEFRNVTVFIKHSFSENEIIIKFDPYQGWWQ